MVAAPVDEAQVRGRGRWNQGLDGLLAVLVLILAFLAGSFAIRNSDFWFHLASGRLLAEWRYTFGVDPFAYTTQNTYWTNHAWLFDLLLYAGHNWIGDASLIVIKALLITALAGLLLNLRRAQGTGWLAAICTALAVLAMSPRLLLQPTCLSYFFLGLSFWLLAKPHADEGAAPNPKHYLLLPLLFILWVNVDEWFLLGPLLIVLFWIGERLQGCPRTPGWLVPASLAACLLNPHTYHVFVLPAELSPVTWTSGLRQDVRFQAVFASPWQSSTYLQPTTWQNPAALAYFVLTALGLLSFFFHQQALRGWRSLVWACFAVVAAWHMRAIPFFAIVAAPITVFNLQDAAASGQWTAAGRWPMVGRFVLVLGVLGLLFLAWPGWLQGYGRQGRHVAWDNHEDPSLRRVAEVLQAWRSQGKLREDERVFAVSPALAHYISWFCPGEKHFFDHRYPLFSQAAGEFEEVCRELRLAPAREEWSGAHKDARQILREHDIHVVILNDPDTPRLLTAEHRLTSDPEGWALLDVAGRAFIFGWKETRTDAFAELTFDPDRLAYGRQGEKEQFELPPAPQKGPGRRPKVGDFWTRFAEAPTPPSWKSDAAMMYLRYFDEVSAQQAQPRLRRSRDRYVASLVGLLASAPDPHAAAVPFAFRLVYQPLFLADAAERAPALPLLAVRAARGALVQNPEDDNAYLRLGMAYFLLRSFTSEHSAQALLPPLASLRYVQIVTALENALRRNPDLEWAHHVLADLYREQHFLDAALEHRQEELRLSRRAGPHPGEEPRSFTARLEQNERAVADLEKEVLDRKTDFALRSRGMRGEPVRLARLAIEMGLARQALDQILLPTREEVLGSEGVKLELLQHLLLGRAEDEELRYTLHSEGLRATKNKLGVHDILSPLSDATVQVYRLPAYEWMVCLQSAAAGDYAAAAAGLQEIQKQMQATSQRLRPLGQRTKLLRGLLPRLLLAELALASQPPLRLGLPPVRRWREETTVLLANDLNALAAEPLLRAQQADLLVVQGMLALEQGSPDAARKAFQDALTLGTADPDRPVEFAGRSIARSYLQRIHREGP